MLPDGTYTAVVDRFEGEQGVLVVERTDAAPAEVVVSRDRLPPSTEPDTVLELRIADDAVVEITLKDAAAVERRRRAQDRFDRLADRPDEG